MTPSKSSRLVSLDVFRGATIASMMLVNNPGDEHVYEPLEHAPWHGWTFTDTVFPFFLWIVGVAMTLSMAKRVERGDGLGKQWLHVLRRAALIFGVGLLLNGFPYYHLDRIRIPGVLQRIALSYCFASLIVYFFKVRGALFASIVLLLGYWVLCLLGNPADPFSLQGYFGTQVDKDILGIAHMYKGEGVPFDPEGLTSTLPSIVQVIFGYFVGHYIQQKGKTYEMITHLFVAAGLLIFTGFCWDMVFPINKKIWTSSYVLVSAGWALCCLSLLIYFIEFRGAKGGWSRFCDVFGKNPLFIFIVAGAFPRLVRLIRWPDGTGGYTNPMWWFLHHICEPLSGGRGPNASLIYAGVLIILYWFLAWVLDRRRIYIRV